MAISSAASARRPAASCSCSRCRARARTRRGASPGSSMAATSSRRASIFRTCAIPPDWRSSGHRPSARCACPLRSRSIPRARTISRSYNSRSVLDSEQIMTLLRPFALGIALAASAALAQDKPAAPPLTGKFGFVNTERILRDAALAQRAQKKIEVEFQKRDQEMARLADQLKRMQEDIEKKSATVSGTQRRTREREFADLNREFQRKQRECRDDLTHRRAKR